MEVLQVSRDIITYLDAFKGSKPVTKSNEVIIVRGKSAHKLKPEEVQPKLEELFKEMEFKEVQVTSEKAQEITTQVDEKIRKTNEIMEDPADVLGLEKMKESFEITGFEADYMIGTKEDIAAYVVMWMDKSGFGPMFVETMVVKLDPKD
jgi:hypothetical protein